MLSHQIFYVLLFFLLGSAPKVSTVASFSRLYSNTLHFFSFQLYTFYLAFFPIFVVVLEEDSTSITFRSHLQRPGSQHTKQCTEATCLRSRARGKSETRTISIPRQQTGDKISDTRRSLVC